MQVRLWTGNSNLNDQEIPRYEHLKFTSPSLQDTYPGTAELSLYNQDFFHKINSNNNITPTHKAQKWFLPWMCSD